MKRQIKNIVLSSFILVTLTGFTGIRVKDADNVKPFTPLSDTGLINGIKYKFVLKGTYYSFRGSFFTNANIECLTSVSYDFNHKIKYNTVVKSMSLLRQGLNWYEVSYTYQKFYFIENTSNWIIAMFPDKNKIVFKMISNKSNIDMFDILLISNGYFKFLPENSGYRVEYFQECLLKSDLLLIPYVSEAKADAIRFINDYKEYLEEMCE